jgi:hypothetical protein
VIAALRARDLWPERDYKYLSRANRAHRARAWADAERISEEATYFADAAALLAESELEELSAIDPKRARHTALLAALRMSPEAEYRNWVRNQPIMAAALVKAGRKRARRLQIALARWITAGMPEAANA